MTTLPHRITVVATFAFFILVACGGNPSSNENDDNQADAPADTNRTPGIIATASSDQAAASTLVTKSSGGTVVARAGAQSSSSRVLLDIPPGAVPSDVQIAVDLTEEADLPEELLELGTSGPIWKLEPSGLEFDKPVTVTVSIPEEDKDRSDNDPSASASMLLAISDDGEIQFLEDTTVERTEDGNLTITGQLSHFSWLVFHESILKVKLEQVGTHRVNTPFEVEFEITAETPIRRSFEALVLALIVSEENSFEVTELSPTSTNNLKFIQLMMESERGKPRANIELGEHSRFSLTYGIKNTGTVTFQCTRPGAGVYRLGVEAIPFKEIPIPINEEFKQLAGAFSFKGSIKPPTISLTAAANVNCVEDPTPTPEQTSTPLPTATSGSRSITIPAYLIDGAHYPISIFTTSGGQIGEYHCQSGTVVGGTTDYQLAGGEWVKLPNEILSIEHPEEAELQPSMCGFGRIGENIVQDDIEVSLEVLDVYCRLFLFWTLPSGADSSSADSQIVRFCNITVGR